jgi:hypothetical protein
VAGTFPKSPTRKSGSGDLTDIREHGIVPDGPKDFKDTVVEECICGSGLFFILATFSDKEISGYYTDAVCYGCGAWVKVPTPID